MRIQATTATEAAAKYRGLFPTLNGKRILINRLTADSFSVNILTADQAPALAANGTVAVYA